MLSLVHRLARLGSGRTALLVALALLLPVLLCGPWIPFIDLVGMCGIDSYPPQLSYGPQHYYLFQFTYILPMALSRLCMDLGVGPRGQVPLFYLAQMGLFLVVIWQFLELLVPSLAWRRLLLVLGGLAAWDGLFLWGGPLAYSCAAALLALATWLSVREAAEPARTAHWPTGLLAVVAVVSHPFALPFALMLFATRLLFLRKSRLQSAGVIALLLVLQIVITRESPEPTPGPILTQLFSFYPEHVLGRFQLLLDWNATATDQLFSAQPTVLLIYFIVLGIIRLAGFLSSPIVAWKAREVPALRMLTLLNTGVFVLFLFARDNELISLWPQRILTFHSCLTYVAGVVAPAYLFQRYRRSRATPVPSTAGPVKLWPFLAAEGALLVLLLAAEFPLLSLGRAIEENLRHARAALLATGVTDAVLTTNIVSIEPFYIRAVPFLLFSDPEIIERRLLISTEWHLQHRHPTRLAEVGLAAGRPRYEAKFLKRRTGLLEVQLTPSK